MMKRMVATGILACLVVGCGQKSETTESGMDGTIPKPAGNTTAASTATTPTSTASKYPDSADGLKLLMTDILTSTKAGDKEKAATLVKGLMLTNHEAWFKHTFGDSDGAKLSGNYGNFLGDFEPSASELFAQMVKKGQTTVQVSRFAKAGDPKAVGLQDDALKAMKAPTPLYSVRFVEPGKELGMHLYSFVYVDGGFRFVSKLNGAKA